MEVESTSRKAPDDGSGWSIPRPTAPSRYALRPDQVVARRRASDQLNWMPSTSPKCKAIEACSVSELRAQLAAQRRLLENQAAMAALPDGGARITLRCTALEAALAARTTDGAASVIHNESSQASQTSEVKLDKLDVTERNVATPKAYTPLPPDEIRAPEFNESLRVDHVIDGTKSHVKSSTEDESHEQSVNPGSTVKLESSDSVAVDMAQSGTERKSTEGNDNVNMDSFEIGEITGLLRRMDIADPSSHRVMDTVMHGVSPSRSGKTTMISVADSIRIERGFRAQLREAELEKTAAMMKWRKENPSGGSAFGSAESRAYVDRLLGTAQRQSTEHVRANSNDSISQADTSASVESNQSIVAGTVVAEKANDATAR